MNAIKNAAQPPTSVSLSHSLGTPSILSAPGPRRSLHISLTQRASRNLAEKKNDKGTVDSTGEGGPNEEPTRGTFKSRVSGPIRSEAPSSSSSSSSKGAMGPRPSHHFWPALMIAKAGRGQQGRKLDGLLQSESACLGDMYREGNTYYFGR